MLVIGTVVFHAEYGRGIIIQVIKADPFPYLVEFDSGLQEQCKLGELEVR